MIRSFYLLGLCIILQATASLASDKKTDKAEWTNLSNGNTLKGWKTLGGNAPFKAENGVIVGTTILNSPNTFLVTEKEYGDFVLELDIKVDGSINSGVQTRSHFNPALNKGKGAVYGRQVEIDPSDRRWSAGIYDESRRQWLYPLSLNPQAQSLYKAGEYNHIKIECIGNETKTWLNGKPVAYVIDTIDQKGFIGLQVHSIGKQEDAGKNIYFKDVRIKTSNLKAEPFPKDLFVVNMQPNSLSKHEEQAGWKLLFDGKTSAGWKGAYKTSFPEKGWVIENGTLTVLPSGGAESTNGGDIVTTEKYAAFDLTFDFKLSPGANSGVKYFVTLSENNAGSAIGLEYQVLDDNLHPDAKNGRDGNRTLSSLYDLITSAKTERFIRPTGEWNRGRVVVYPDNRVEHYLNGAKVIDYNRGSKEFRDLVAISKYKDWKNFGEAPEGHILLQDHGDKVSFRSLKIKKLN